MNQQWQDYWSDVYYHRPFVVLSIAHLLTLFKTGFCGKACQLPKSKSSHLPDQYWWTSIPSRLVQSWVWKNALLRIVFFFPYLDNFFPFPGELLQNLWNILVIKTASEPLFLFATMVCDKKILWIFIGIICQQMVTILSLTHAYIHPNMMYRVKTLEKKKPNQISLDRSTTTV